MVVFPTVSPSWDRSCRQVSQVAHLQVQARASPESCGAIRVDLAKIDIDTPDALVPVTGTSAASSQGDVP